MVLFKVSCNYVIKIFFFRINVIYYILQLHDIAEILLKLELNTNQSINIFSMATILVQKINYDIP